MAATLLDSVILIDFLNGVAAARSYVGRLSGERGISPITYAEVLVGVTREGVPATRAFLDAFLMYGIDRDTAAQAAQLRRQHRWKLPDALQAALAQQHGLQLATRNTKDFDPARHTFVVVPYHI